MSSSDSLMKPPNVLVYTGESDEKVFKNIASNLLRCLHPDKYVVYRLNTSQVLTTPWKENVELLVVCCGDIESDVLSVFQDFVRHQGRAFVMCSNFDMPELGFTCEKRSTSGGPVKISTKAEVAAFYEGDYAYKSAEGTVLANTDDERPAIVKMSVGRAVFVSSEVYLALDPSVSGVTDSNHLRSLTENHLSILKGILKDNFCLEVFSLEIPRPTSGYIICKDDRIPSELTSTTTISLGKLENAPSEEIIVPLLTENNSQGSLLFNKNQYFSILNTKCVGKTVVFFPVVTSTMIPADHLSSLNGIVIIANRQISGKGRGGNAWISPEGCAMFTLNMTFPMTSRLGQRLSCIQHIASLAVVHGIRRNPGFENLDLRVKWPNDIYLGRDVKIGGVLVTSSILGNSASVHIGIGVNTSNQRPTACICSAIEAYNATVGDNRLPLLSTEEVIAFSLTEIENIVEDFIANGESTFLSLYYKYWLHDGQRVTIENLGVEASVLGVDDFGFLIVETDEKKKITLQPDGNRFDLMKNLILTK